MIEDVIKVKMPVGESLVIRKNRHLPDNVASAEGLKRLCVVSGIHGDELEGQYICYLLNKVVREKSEHLKGVGCLSGIEPDGHRYDPARISRF